MRRILRLAIITVAATIVPATVWAQSTTYHLHIETFGGGDEHEKLLTAGPDAPVATIQTTEPCGREKKPKCQPDTTKMQSEFLSCAIEGAALYAGARYYDPTNGTWAADDPPRAPPGKSGRSYDTTQRFD